MRPRQRENKNSIVRWCEYNVIPICKVVKKQSNLFCIHVFNTVKSLERNKVNLPEKMNFERWSFLRHPHTAKHHFLQSLKIWAGFGQLSQKNCTMLHHYMWHLSQNEVTIFHTDYVYIYHYGGRGLLLDLPGILIDTEDNYHPQVCQNFHLM